MTTNNATDFERETILADLRVDHRSETIGIDSERPIFSWIVRTKIPEATLDTARVLVAEVDPATQTVTTVWDSGHTEHRPGTLPELRYDGEPLRSLAHYEWSVEATVADHTVTAKSSFVTGLFDRHWRDARWIGTGSRPQIDAVDERGDTGARAMAPSGVLAAPLLRHEFALPSSVASAHLVVAAGGYARATINGEPVSGDVLSPGFTDYDSRVQYVVNDVTALLREGANAIGLELGRGFYGMTNPNAWSWQKAPWHDEPCARAVLRVLLDTGETRDIVTDETWLAVGGPTILDDLYGGEIYDARRERPGFDRVGHDSSNWSAATAVGGPRGALHSQAQQPIRVVETLAATAVTEPQPGVFVVAFPRVIAGWVRVTLRGRAGDCLQLRYGEQLNDDGMPNADDTNGYFSDGFQTDTVTLAGGKDPESWESRFSYKGFQYVQVTGWPGGDTPTLSDIEARVVHSDVAETSIFDASEPLLADIHRIVVDTMLNNLHGLPTDTPKFEKNGWTGDGLVGADMFLTNLDSRVLLDKWVDDIADTRHDGGPPALIAPNAGYFGVDTRAPVWHAAYVLIPWELYRHTGSADVLDRHYEGMADYVRFETSRSPGGIADTILADWVSPDTDPGGGNAPEDTRVSATAYLFRMLDVMAQIAVVLDRPVDAEYWRSETERVRTAFIETFVDTGAGVVRGEGDNGYRQTHNALALAFEILTDHELAERVAENLATDVRGRDHRLDTGAIGTKYLLPVLSEWGHAETALAVAMQTGFPSWGFWLENGATSTWEHWKIASRSRGHYFLGTIDDWLTGWVAGLRPEAPGWREIVVAPALTESLDHASASVETPYGRASVAWRRTDGNVAMQVEIPVGATGIVTVPGRPSRRVGAGRWSF
ncbi:alpha-L-rhamnosidase [Glaciibacter superstes]|uniref:alpha-L-rhamnosidase n=1 Tax=Glaciibacter superstes TaxID=501023 RepID=UPI0003B5B7E1|nr:alpha-L-rhamnosidase [Glaciibacter superstes]